MAGDVWLALTRDPEALVDRVAVQGGEVREVAQTMATRIARPCRFVGTVVERRDAIAAAAAYLESEGWGIDPGAYVSVPPVPSRATKRVDGDTSVYSGDGQCRACNAEVSFHDAGGLIEP